VISGDDEMNFLLECVVPQAHGFLLLHPIVVGAYDRRYPRPAMGDAYPDQGAPGHAEARVPFPGCWVRRTCGEIPSAHALIVGCRSDDVVHHYD
jgi:hypothetical protein